MYSNSMKIQQMLFLPDVIPCLHSDAKRLVIDDPTPWLNTTVTPKDDRVSLAAQQDEEGAELFGNIVRLSQTGSGLYQLREPQP